jgi:hypothetical protein
VEKEERVGEGLVSLCAPAASLGTPDTGINRCGRFSEDLLPPLLIQHGLAKFSSTITTTTLH